MLTGKMPDITAAQIVAIVGNVIAVAIAFGVSISTKQQNALLALTGTVGAILILADSHLRARRGQSEALRYAVDAAAAAGGSAPPAGAAPPAAGGPAAAAVANTIQPVSPQAAAALRGQ